MPGRQYSAGNGYRYGFNGKEQDPEISGNGNHYDYGFRIYNPRLGRFLSVDPLTQSYPWYTPYQFAGNMPIWAIDLDGLEEMKANSVANVIKDINGNVITKPTVINDQTSSADVIPGVRRLNSTHIEVTPGLVEKSHLYWNTFTWKQVEGNKYICLESNTPIGQEAGGKPPKTNLIQTNDDVPVTGIPQTSTVINPINDKYTSSNTFSRNINFVPSNPQFATPADATTVNGVAVNAPNSTVRGKPITTTNGNTTITTTTTTRIRSIVTIDLLTSNSSTSPTEAGTGADLQTARYNTIRQQLINRGVPAGNVRRGKTLFNVPANQMNNQVNQVNFNVRTTTTRTTTGTQVNTTTQ